MTYSYAPKLVGCVVGMSLSWLGAATAQQSVEDFYKGKTINMVVSAAPGGGADFFARQMAPFLAKHIPGKPTITISNVEGAAGLTAAIRLQSREPKDGTVIAMLQTSNLYATLLSSQRIEFDPRQVSWIGSVNKEIYTVAVAVSNEVKTTQDLFTKKIKMGATTFSNVNRVIPIILNEYYGTKFEVVTGFAGSDDAWLATQRGEVQGRMIPVDGLLSFRGEAEWIRDGRMKVLMQTAITPRKEFDAPNIFEFTKDPEVIALTRFFLAPLDAGRPFATPAGVPADRLAALRKAFDLAVADPEFIATVEKTGAKADPITGEQIHAIVNELYAASPSVIEKAKKLTNPAK